MMKNEELILLRGGYGCCWLRCNGTGSNCSLPVAWCGNDHENIDTCNIGCPGTTVAICTC
ncbi:MAG: hypothetical protein KBB87_07165 [Candidatus Methanofastidiosum sp.]|nr:hypothetical protein [Methanofastidiosum sp.]